MKNYIKENRRKVGKTQEQVAREIDMTLGQYKNIENGITKNPGIYAAIKIKRALKIKDIEELFDIEE